MEHSFMYEKLRQHIGHNVVVTGYGKPDEDPVDICVECLDCNDILVSAESFEEDEGLDEETEKAEKESSTVERAKARVLECLEVMGDRLIEIICKRGFTIATDINTYPPEFRINDDAALPIAFRIRQDTPNGEHYETVIACRTNEASREEYIEGIMRMYGYYDINEETSDILRNTENDNNPPSVIKVVEDAVWKENKLLALARDASYYLHELHPAMAYTEREIRIRIKYMKAWAKERNYHVCVEYHNDNDYPCNGRPASYFFCVGEKSGQCVDVDEPFLVTAAQVDVLGIDMVKLCVEKYHVEYLDEFGNLHTFGKCPVCGADVYYALPNKSAVDVPPCFCRTCGKELKHTEVADYEDNSHDYCM